MVTGSEEEDYWTGSLGSSTGIVGSHPAVLHRSTFSNDEVTPDIGATLRTALPDAPRGILAAL